MSDYDRKTFTDRIAAKAKQQNAAQIPAFRALQTVGAVMANLITNDDKWNRYLQLLQGQIDKTRAQKEAAQSRMNDPAIWDPQHLAKLKSDIREADAMIAAWELAMQLPKALIEGGQEATELLNKMETKDDKGASTEAA